MLKLSQLLAALPAARCSGASDQAAIEFSGVSTDSRSVSKGQLFVALTGPHFDGHAFVQAAADRGALAALVSRPITPGAPSKLSTPSPTWPAHFVVIQVDDTLQALQTLASWWRAQWVGHMIAVTGSNGKTTVKQMIAQILAAQVGAAHAWSTPGNLNNHIGVPLSILGLSAQHRMAVLELGMNHPGEIEELAAMARPDVALVNNAQREHQEFMKSVEAVAHENGQVFSALSAQGTAIYPKDPLHEGIWHSLAAGRPTLRFGFVDSPAGSPAPTQECIGRRLGEQAGQQTLEVRLPSHDTLQVTLSGLGEHLALNALAAAGCAYAAGCSAQAIVSGLQAFRPVRGRGEIHHLPGGGVLIDDTYNANPDSVRAAVMALASLPAPHALVLGDMGEVGDQSEAFHNEVLRCARDQHIHDIWLHGAALQTAQQQTGLGRHFHDIDALSADLWGWTVAAQRQQQQPSIWVKGSRFMKMERVVNALMKEPACS